MDRLPIVVNLLKAEDALRWDEFVRRCPQATFFHLSAWRDIMEEVFDHRTFYLYAERAGDIVGVLPLAGCAAACSVMRWCRPFCVWRHRR